MLCWPKSLSSKVRNVSEETDSTELEVKTATNHYGHHMALNQQAKKEITVLAGVIDPAYQGKFRLLLCYYYCYKLFSSTSQEKGPLLADCLWTQTTSLPLVSSLPIYLQI